MPSSSTRAPPSMAAIPTHRWPRLQPARTSTTPVTFLAIPMPSLYRQRPCITQTPRLQAAVGFRLTLPRILPTTPRRRPSSIGTSTCSLSVPVLPRTIPPCTSRVALEVSTPSSLMGFTNGTGLLVLQHGEVWAGAGTPHPTNYCPLYRCNPYVEPRLSFDYVLFPVCIYPPIYRSNQQLSFSHLLLQPGVIDDLFPSQLR